jgi:hypothetical protein
MAGVAGPFFNGAGFAADFVAGFAVDVVASFGAGFADTFFVVASFPEG